MTPLPPSLLLRGHFALFEDRLARFLCRIEDGYPISDINPYHCK